MAPRRTTAERRKALADGIRQAGQSGELTPGDLLPTVRELSERYGLSVRTVSQELQKLVDDGVLHTIPRVGTFLAGPVTAATEGYLLLGAVAGSPYSSAPHINRIRLGFEERVAQLGGASLAMPIDEAADHSRAGDLPDLAGIFDASNSPTPGGEWYANARLPRVRFGPVQRSRKNSPVDTVYFDDADGGRQATQHLQQHGHHDIAFLGLHVTRKTSPLYQWSADREQGWRKAMQRHGDIPDHLLCLPDEEPASWEDETQVATVAARRLVARGGFTAVVATSDHAVIGLFAALRDADVPPSDWPAVVGFDGLPEASRYVLTSVRLPWEDIGRTAANLIWERKSGRLTGPAERRLVTMTLIPRMTSRKEWTTATGSTSLLINHN